MTPCNEPGCICLAGFGMNLSCEVHGTNAPAKAAVEAVCERCAGTGREHYENPAIAGGSTECRKCYGRGRMPSPAPQSVEAVGEAVRYTSECVPPFRMLVLESDYDNVRARCFDFEAMAERGSRACARMQSKRDAALASLQEMRGEVERLMKLKAISAGVEKMLREDVDSQFATISAKDARIAELETALKDLSRAFVMNLEAARERIVSLGGQCDSVETMERGDPYLRQAKATLQKGATPG